MDYSRPPQDHYALGQQLARLRNRGVLTVGSGNMVHNLRAVQPNVADSKADDWAKEFDALQDFLKLGEVSKMAHPTHEHFLPLLYGAGAARPTEMPRFFNVGFQEASISMRSVLWG